MPMKTNKILTLPILLFGLLFGSIFTHAQTILPNPSLSSSSRWDETGDIDISNGKAILESKGKGVSGALSQEFDTEEGALYQVLLSATFESRILDSSDTGEETIFDISFTISDEDGDWIDGGTVQAARTIRDLPNMSLSVTEGSDRVFFTATGDTTEIELVSEISYIGESFSSPPSPDTIIRRDSTITINNISVVKAQDADAWESDDSEFAQKEKRLSGDTTPNIIYDYADEEFSMEIEKNEVYWITDINYSNGASTHIEYDDLGNKTSVVNISAEDSQKEQVVDEKVITKEPATSDTEDPDSVGNSDAEVVNEETIPSEAEITANTEASHELGTLNEDEQKISFFGKIKKFFKKIFSK